MPYTLGQAAKASGRSKATIHRAVRSGRLSASRGEDGGWLIDPAELHRVYPPRVTGDGAGDGVRDATRFPEKFWWRAPARLSARGRHHGPIASSVARLGDRYPMAPTH
jgi:hypothetical protein